MRIIFIVGPTASGKTAIAIKLAKQISAEIIVADSRSIYKAMPILTATPSLKDRQGIKHHLLEFLNFKQTYSSASFSFAAQDIISKLASKKKNVIVVGGSGNYIDALYFSAFFRSKVRSLPSSIAPHELLAKIRDYYPKLELTKSDLGNHRRLEKIYQYGPIKRTKDMPRYSNSEIYGINPDLDFVPENKHRRSLPDLRDNIVNRLEWMVSSGLENELKKIVDSPGGKEILQVTTMGGSYLKFLSGVLTWPETIEAMTNENYQLARKQLTWFRKNPNIQWFKNSANLFNFLANLEQ